jgi:hypothetical protein
MLPVPMGQAKLRRGDLTKGPEGGPAGRNITQPRHHRPIPRPPRRAIAHPQSLQRVAPHQGTSIRRRRYTPCPAGRFPAGRAAPLRRSGAVPFLPRPARARADAALYRLRCAPVLARAVADLLKAIISSPKSHIFLPARRQRPHRHRASLPYHSGTEIPSLTPKTARKLAFLTARISAETVYRETV